MTDPRTHATTHATTDATRGNGLYVPRGATAGGLYAVDIDPERAGWAHSSLRVIELGPGGTHTFTTPVLRTAGSKTNTATAGSITGVATVSGAAWFYGL